jgi:thiol-disulfide isomerase/thioredoxin
MGRLSALRGRRGSSVVGLGAVGAIGAGGAGGAGAKRAAVSLLVLAFAAFATGCDDAGGKSNLPAPPTTSRSNAVIAADTAGAQAAGKPTGATGATAQPAPAQPKAPRKLCTGQTLRPAPKATVETAAAPGAQAPVKPIPFGVGKWVWVNLWAGWCKPCKEEMPRLIAWQKKLSAAGVLIELAFVSLDDDQRQMQRFLEEQPTGGVRASYWLPEGGGRTAFLGALGLKDATGLPVHAFVAPSGQVACVFSGEVEESDYEGLAAFVGAKL